VKPGMIDPTPTCMNCGTEWGGRHRAEYCAHPGCKITICADCSERGLEFACGWPTCERKLLCRKHAIRIEDWEVCFSHCRIAASVIVGALRMEEGKRLIDFFEGSSVPDNLIGTISGSLTVVWAEKIKSGQRATCVCVCGRILRIHASLIKRKMRRSCGCRPNNRTHGETGDNETTEYRIWGSMLTRCGNPKASNFHLYGGRGITVCESWRTFENFLRDMGRRPSTDYSLDRINNNGNYEPGNCRWATRLEQSNNTRKNRRITLNGVTLTAAEWAVIIGVHPNTIYSRMRKHSDWTPSQLLSGPHIEHVPVEIGESDYHELTVPVVITEGEVVAA
jgi:hypothetical protein